MRLAVADGLELGRMQRINLAPALIALLGQHAAGQAQLAGEYVLQNVVICDVPHRVTSVSVNYSLASQDKRYFYYYSVARCGPMLCVMLKVKHEATFFGANPFSANPVIVASILSDGDTVGAIEALTQGCVLLHDAFPEWLDATAPAIQEPVAQIAQTAARWALGALNEVEGYLHDAGAAAMPGGARLWLGFHHQNVSLSALRLALEVLQTYAGLSKKLEGNRIDSALASLWQLCRNHHPDFQARILMQGARARDIPVLQFITGSRFLAIWLGLSLSGLFRNTIQRRWTRGWRTATFKGVEQNGIFRTWDSDAKPSTCKPNRRTA